MRLGPPLAALCLLTLGLLPTAADARKPDILLVTVDTLRADRLSSYGYEKPTSPVIDQILRRGVRFEEARTPEPLTAPAMASMLTGLHPHEHGASRNGLRIRPDLESWPRILARRGYRTVAFVGNWTLRAEISGLDEHFDEYEGIFSRRRWFGIAYGEATAEDLTDEALDWLARHVDDETRAPYLLWVHYVEPHAPYRFREEFAPRLRLGRSPGPSERYDTEIAYVDRSIGRLTQGVASLSDPASPPLVIFTADHGESLGERGYWGHGRNLDEPGLRIPLGFTWPSRIVTGLIPEPSSLLDVGPTVLGLLDLPPDILPHGYDWSARLLGREPIRDDPETRVTLHQAHKGAVQRSRNERARRQGLLEVGLVRGGVHKEVVRVKGGKEQVRIFDLLEDPLELDEANPAAPSDALAEWLERVRLGLEAADELPPAVLDEESLDHLRDLGYID